MEGKVAIVESDELIVKALREPLDEAGFLVEVAPMAAEALSLCRRFFPQVVLIDTQLPDGDGLEVCRRIRATTRISHIHIILLAHSLDRQLRIASLKAGANDYIVVPFDPEEVMLRVRNALRRATFDNLTDPVTGLPGTRLIQASLRNLVGNEGDWALLALTTRYLESFEEVHGFLSGQEVLRSVAQVLAEGADRWGGPDDLIGHSGGGRFVVITTLERAGPLAENLAACFQEEVEKHYTFREREQGYVVAGEGAQQRQMPLMKLDIRRTQASDGPFYDIRSLTEALG